jgi:hypothetical protein
MQATCKPLTPVAAGAGPPPGMQEAPRDVAAALQLLLNPSAQLRDVGSALRALGSDAAHTAAAQRVAEDVLAGLAQVQARRAGVSASTLFPFIGSLQQ